MRSLLEILFPSPKKTALKLLYAKYMSRKWARAGEMAGAE